MSILKIRILPDPILHESSTIVQEDEFGDELNDLMSDMATTMYANKGVGLAAPQVGISRRFFVADLGVARQIANTEKHGIVSSYGRDLIRIVNPEIIEHSSDKRRATEGCLSYPGLDILVNRWHWIVLKYQTPYGEDKTERHEGLAARIVQHEMEHLDGVTLYNYASNLKRRKYKKALIRKLEKLKRYLDSRGK